MADQLAAGWLPAYGYDSVHAPRLTELAAGGVRFDAAYCPAPLCAPSRAAMLTGRYCSRIGVFDNAAELPASVPTVAHMLRASGYHTALAGKMHFVGPDQLHGFEARLTTDVYPAGIDWTPQWERPVSDRLPWYHSMESVLTPARCTASMQTDYDDEVAFHAVRHINDLARSGGDQPFFFVVSFTSPHDPWEIPSRYWDLYDEASIPLPEVSDAPADPHSLRLREMCGADEVELSEEQIRRARHGYFAAVSYVDERIGMVLDALRSTGLDETTTIAFTADHGEFLGERGLWYKMSFLDPSARVPLIVRPPRLPAAQVVSTPVSVLDLAPTLIELGPGADLLDEADFDGRPLFSSPARPVVCEYHAEGVNAPSAMVRRDSFKLIVCPTDPDQLYDLAADPLELVNLAGRPEFTETMTALRAELDARLDLAEIERRALASQRERRLVARALATGEVAAWDYQPHVDASMQYVRNRADLYELQRRARLEVR
jgi:choline-sulfatase